MSQCDQVELVLEEGVLRVGINRPEKKNALNIAMYEALGAALLAADEDPQVRVILLHGVPEAFSSGNDMADFDKRDPDKPSAASLLLLILHGLKKPLIAAVSGLAVGIGTTLLLHCDLVYAAPDTRFRLPFVDLGLCPEAGSSLLLPATAGLRLASEVLLLADVFDTEKAIALGLVNQAIELDRLLGHALASAKRLALKPALALTTTKQLLKAADQQPVAERMQQEFKHFSALLQTDESRAIREQFIQRRNPR